MSGVVEVLLPGLKSVDRKATLLRSLVYASSRAGMVESLPKESGQGVLDHALGRADSLSPDCVSRRARVERPRRSLLESPEWRLGVEKVRVRPFVRPQARSEHPLRRVCLTAVVEFRAVVIEPIAQVSVIQPRPVHLGDAPPGVGMTIGRFLRGETESVEVAVRPLERKRTKTCSTQTA